MSESAAPHVRTTTSLSGNWLMKQGLFLLVLLVFGFWGLADALYFYPRRGLEDASYKLRNYLTAASEAGKLIPSEVGLPDPQRTYEELDPRMEQLAKAAVGPGNDAKNAKLEFERARWLEALSRTWKLTTEPQVVVSPGQLPKDFVDAATRTVRYDPVRGVGLVVSQPGSAPVEIPPQRLLGELVQKWNVRDQVKPLSGYDMPLQWVFVTVGFVGGAGMLFTVLRASAKSTGGIRRRKRSRFPAVKVSRRRTSKSSTSAAGTSSSSLSTSRTEPPTRSICSATFRWRSGC